MNRWTGFGMLLALAACATGTGAEGARGAGDPAEGASDGDERGQGRQEGDDEEPAVGDGAASDVFVEAACDGLDDDGDGLADEGCACELDAEQACFLAGAAARGVGACRDGAQRCVGDVEFPAWGDCRGAVGPTDERCGDGVDDDCDGAADDGCDTIDVDIALDGDCVWAACPESHPFPVGCDVQFVGGDDRGCVAYDPGASEVYFQEGDVCDAGHLSGTLTCSTEPGAGLDAATCAIDKDEPIYVADPDDCPGRDCLFGC